MGRKPLKKNRADNPELKHQWVVTLTPLYMSGQLIKSTTEDIAKHLGIAKATLYKYYRSKKEIINDVIDHKIRELAKFDQSLFDETVPYRHRYFGAVETAALQLAGISIEFLAHLKATSPDQWVKIDRFLDLISLKMEEFYALGIKEEVLNPFDPKLSALVDKIFVTALSDPQFLRDNGLSLHESLREYFAQKSKGIFKSDS